MATYRLRPPEVQAIQYIGEVSFLRHGGFDKTITRYEKGGPCWMMVQDYIGQFVEEICNVGDYIVLGNMGFPYIMNKEVFESLYEFAPEDENRSCW